MSPQFWLTQYFRKTNILNNQYAILICNQKKLKSIESNYPSVLHVSPNVEDGSPIHCINFKPTNRTCKRTSRVFKFNLLRKWLLIAFCLENPLSHCLALFPVRLAISDHRFNSH